MYSHFSDLMPITRRIAFKIRFKLNGAKSFQRNFDNPKASEEPNEIMSGCSRSTCVSFVPAKITE